MVEVARVELASRRRSAQRHSKAITPPLKKFGAGLTGPGIPSARPRLIPVGSWLPRKIKILEPRGFAPLWDCLQSSCILVWPRPREKMVGLTGFAPAISCSQGTRVSCYATARYSTLLLLLESPQVFHGGVREHFGQPLSALKLKDTQTARFVKFCPHLPPSSIFRLWNLK